MKNNEDLYKEINKWKKIALSITSLVVILVISTVSFILGRQSAGKSIQNIKSVSPNESDRRLILGTEADLVNPTLGAENTLKESEDTTLSELEATPSWKPTPTTKTQPIPPVREIILTAESRLEGFRSSNGSGSTNSNIRAGRDNELVTRAFLSFDISRIPNNADVVLASLKIFQTKTLGNPYKVGGNLLIDHLNYGDSLDKNDFSTPALLSNFDIVSDKPSTGWRKVDVTNQLINDLVSAKTSTQFRLHFEKEILADDENGDYTYFESSENTQHSGNTPELIVEYTLK